MDQVLARLERAGMQGDCAPKLNPKTSAEDWIKKAAASGHIAPQPKLANEKPKGESFSVYASALALPCAAVRLLHCDGLSGQAPGYRTSRAAPVAR
jgi:hypothetical protein